MELVLLLYFKAAIPVKSSRRMSENDLFTQPRLVLLNEVSIIYP